jgi:hypothetical protein
MQTIVQLLNEKNQHLEAFAQLNAEEMDKFFDGNFDSLEIFYNSREALLDMIRAIDTLMDETQAKLDPHLPIDDQFRRDVLRALNKKNDLVTGILAQDLQILSTIEQAKSKIIRELRQVRSSRKAVSAYKSGDAPAKLDEEA